VPALWCARPRRTRGIRDVAMLAGIAFATFALCSPFVILDAGTAAHDIGYEIVHYAVRGHGAAGEGRGLGNLIFYLRYIGNVLGPLAWLSLPGAAWLARRDAAARRVLLFPAFYVAFMALQRAAFGRNMEPVFPLASAFALAPLERFGRTAPPRWRRVTAAGGMLVALAGVVVVAWPLGASRERWLARDSRTEAMRGVEALRSQARGVIDRALHVHGEDLVRAGSGWIVADAESAGAIAAQGGAGWMLLASAD